MTAKQKTLVAIAAILSVLVVLGYATWDQLSALLMSLAGVL